MRDLRRHCLKKLGWTVVRDTMVYAPGDEERQRMFSLAAAARFAGLPDRLEDLWDWQPG